MKHTKIKLLKLAAALSMIVGFSAPVTVQASLIDFAHVNTVLNGNTAEDPFAGFGLGIPGLTTNVVFTNNQAVTLVYNPTNNPPNVPFADLENMSLNVANNNGGPWTGLKVEFLDLTPANTALFDDSPQVNLPNPNTGTFVVSGTTIDVAYTFNNPAPNPFAFRLLNTIEDFAANQAGNTFRIRITPTGVVPVPAAVWLFGTGLLALFGGGNFTRRKLSRI